MDYKALLKPYEEEMKKALFEFVSINSIYDEKTIAKGKPFGEGVYNALTYIAKLGEKYGFKVDRCDGYCTELTLGEGPITIGLYAHSDVVPISGDWKKPPFEPYVENGNIYGRGTSDDKGPLIATFFALVALRDKDMLKGYNVRFVIGGDEERGSSCLDYYFEKLHKPYPDYGFTPDSDFPLIYGEKGIVDFWPEVVVHAPEIVSIRGGVATNAVCDRVEVITTNPDELEKYLKEKNVDYVRENDKVVFLGKSAHGSTPEAGVNAAIITLKHLGDFYEIDEFSDLGNRLSDPSGKLFNGYASTRLLGETTYCLGMINFEKGILKFSINFRHPEGINPEDFKNNFDEKFKTHSVMKEPSRYLLFEPESRLVSTLYKAYQEESGDFKSPMLTTGGGTYAKHAKNTIAFGALFPGRESTMHEPNEYMPMEDFLLSASIYARAIFDLGNLK